MINPLIASLTRNQGSFHPVVSFTPGTDKLAALKLTQNGDLPEGIADNLDRFASFMENLREVKQARYLIGVTMNCDLCIVAVPFLMREKSPVGCI